MFTGLVEEIGQVCEVSTSHGKVFYRIIAPKLAPDCAIGESVAVNGCCLTVVEVQGEEVAFDLLQETCRRTNLNSLKKGSHVNLERAIPANGRFGGHFVTGHIDNTGVILKWEKFGKDWILEVQIAPSYRHLVVEKGCVAIDGISLTIAEVAEDLIRIFIIPHTFENTALKFRKEGDAVNLEFDLVAKYIERMMSQRFDSVKPE